VALPVLLSALAALLAPGHAGDGGISPERPMVSFEKRTEFNCYWVMRDAAQPLAIRGSIRPGEQSPELQIFDPMFNDWSDIEYPTVELSAGGSGARGTALAYVSHSTPAHGPFLAIFLDEEARGVVGGAMQLQVWKDGRLVLDMALAGTPSAEELAACVSEGD
jgi:hypothetical protein